MRSKSLAFYMAASVVLMPSTGLGASFSSRPPSISVRPPVSVPRVAPTPAAPVRIAPPAASTPRPSVPQVSSPAPKVDKPPAYIPPSPWGPRPEVIDSFRRQQTPPTRSVDTPRQPTTAPTWLSNDKPKVLDTSARPEPPRDNARTEPPSSSSSCSFLSGLYNPGCLSWGTFWHRPSAQVSSPPASQGAPSAFSHPPAAVAAAPADDGQCRPPSPERPNPPPFDKDGKPCPTNWGELAPGF